MPDVRLPLSGNVTQSINPWTWIFNPMNSQFGVVNVNLGSSSDPETERQILEDVGSYGRQLGRIGDVLAILLKHVPLDDLSENESAAVRQLRDQLTAVDRVKARRAADR